MDLVNGIDDSMDLIIRLEVLTRVHHDPLKAAFHGFQNCSIQKALNPKSSLSILISKAQEQISKNRVLSLEIEKNFGNFFGLLPRD